ncbi:MAG: hypothetical protein AB7V32_03210 [Candidatus Berkiella sp.]
MLLIQALKYLIDQLELHLKERLGATLPSEQVLADKLKISTQERVAVIRAQPVAVLEIDEALLSKLKDLKLVEVDQKGVLKDSKGLNVALLKLPPLNCLKVVNSCLYAQQLPLEWTKHDDVLLHFGITWGQLMLTTFEGFKGRLDDSLSKEELTDKKTYILSRFKRQLVLISEYAKKVLAEREKAFHLAKEKLSFDDEVDTWVQSLVMECINEAIELSQHAMSNAKSTVDLKILGSISHESKAGRTEGLLKCCQEVLNEFVAFCQKANEQSKVKNVQPNSMVDLFPSHIQKHIAIRLIHERTAQDLVERLFEIAKDKHYPKRTLNFSAIDPTAFDSALALKKCKQLAIELQSFEDIVRRYKDEDPAYWEDILQQTHRAADNSKHYAPRFSMQIQGTTLMWEQIHQALWGRLPPGATKDRHSSCKMH